MSRTSAASKLVDVRHIGDEITNWSAVVESDIERAIYQNLKHYNYFYDNKDANKWGAAWIAKNFTKPDQVAYAACDEWRVNTTFGGLCKMHMAGAPLSERNIEWLKTRAKELIANGYRNRSNKKEQVVVEKKPIRDSAKNKVSDFIAAIEEVIDQYHDEKVLVDAENYSVYNELKKIEATKQLAQSVYAYYLPIYEEIEELVTQKTPELVEGYKKHMPKLADQKKYLTFLKQILDDVNSFMNAKTAAKVRKPREKKKVPIEKLIANVKYQKESLEFKVTSVDPVNLVGATEAFLFNTKYRTLTRMVAMAQDGFSIKGTTVMNVREAECLKKTLRKPEDVLPQICQATKARVSRIFVDLKTKESVANTRLNEDTIILKVFK